MLKLDNKGMSLMEILVSIILISIVLTFLFQLLTDLKNETTNNDFVYNNQINRAEIIKTIAQDLQNYNLISISDSSTDNIKINFNFLNNKKGILTTKKENYHNEIGEEDIKYILSYTSASGEKNTWTIKDAEIDNCYDFYFYNDEIAHKYFFKLNLYLYNNPYHEKNNKNNNNPVDDIEITFNGDNAYLSKDVNILTKEENSNKKVNTCTK